MENCTGRYKKDFYELSNCYVSDGSISCSICQTKLSMKEGNTYSQFVEHSHRHDISNIGDKLSKEMLHQFSGKAPFKEVVEQYNHNLDKGKTTVLVLPSKNKEEYLEDLLIMLEEENLGTPVELHFEKIPNFLRLSYSNKTWRLFSDMGDSKLWNRRYVYLKDYSLNMSDYCMAIGGNYSNVSQGDACRYCECYIDEHSEEVEKLFFAREHFIGNVPKNGFVQKQTLIRWALRLVAFLLLYTFIKTQGSIVINTLEWNSFDFSFLLTPYNIVKLSLAGFLLYKSDIPLKTIAKYALFFVLACVLLYLAIILLVLFMVFANIFGGGETAVEESGDNRGYNEQNPVYYGPTPQQQAEIAHLERQINYMARTGRKL